MTPQNQAQLQTPSPTAPGQDTLEGSIEIVTFHNEENGFCVLRVRVKSHKNTVTVLGSLPAVTTGADIKATGEWINDKRFGLQFKATQMEIKPPSSTDGLEKYLSSGLIKGVGQSNAKKLVKKFGDKVFEIIDKYPERLKEVPGFGQGLIDKILTSWEDQKAIRDIMLFLHTHDISTARAVRIYKLYGNEAIKIIKDNPYRLAKDVRGIGFLSADKVAMKLGIGRDSLIRARAGISYALSEALNEGHCALPMDELISAAETLLNIDQERLEEGLNCELEEGILIKNNIGTTPCIFLKTLYNAEKEIAERLRLISEAPMPYKVLDLEGAIQWVEQENNLALSSSQKQALENTLTKKVTIITGGPGVGKTTLLQSIIKILNTQDLNFALCAPTGRAAKRMTEATKMEAKTIHRLLNINPLSGSFGFGEYEPLKCDVVIVDEASMVDVSLMNALLSAIPKKALVIFVGDKDQLPSVGPGQVLGDMIASGVISCVHLTETFRQAASSNIIQIAQRINKGIMPELKGFGAESDFYFLEIPEAEDVLSTVVDLVKARLPQKYGYSPLQDIQVLCPMNRGMVGTRTFNLELQRALNPPAAGCIQKYGSSYSVGDKVIQIENNYQKDVYNGDIGYITAMDAEEEDLIISFDGREVHYGLQDLDEINLAYAMTIHKSQGSEYPVVIIPLMTQHFPMLKKNLVYTGITRGKKLVILVGQQRALQIAVSNQNLVRRWSMLETHLRNSGKKIQ